MKQVSKGSVDYQDTHCSLYMLQWPIKIIEPTVFL